MVSCADSGMPGNAIALNDEPEDEHGCTCKAWCELLSNGRYCRVFAELWFAEQRWPDGVECPRCASRSIQRRTKPTPYRCGDCKYDFSVKSNSLMHNSKLPLKTWGLAIYILTTSIRGASSMKLHRDLGVTQKTAWHLAHRLRDAYLGETPEFEGPVEADETYIGGRVGRMNAARRRRLGGNANKSIVAGVRDRATGRVSAARVESTDRPTLQGFVVERAVPTATVYTDEHLSYLGIPRRHQTVNHSAGQLCG